MEREVSLALRLLKLAAREAIAGAASSAGQKIGAKSLGKPGDVLTIHASECPADKGEDCECEAIEVTVGEVIRA